MPNAHDGREAGDGRFVVDKSFIRPLDAKEKAIYTPLLATLIIDAGLDTSFSPDDPMLPDALLALSQRYKVSFSNGCDKPDKWMREYMIKHKHPNLTLTDLTQLIRDSTVEDAKHNMLFQQLTQYAGADLKREIFSFQAWKPLPDQETDHLPERMTRIDKPESYGMGNDSPYFDVILPLHNWIDDDANGGTYADRYFRVDTFLGQTVPKTTTLQELEAKTKVFLEEQTEERKEQLIRIKELPQAIGQEIRPPLASYDLVLPPWFCSFVKKRYFDETEEPSHESKDIYGDAFKAVSADLQRAFTRTADSAEAETIIASFCVAATLTGSWRAINPNIFRAEGKSATTFKRRRGTVQDPAQHYEFDGYLAVLQQKGFIEPVAPELKEKNIWFRPTNTLIQTIASSVRRNGLREWYIP